MKEVLGKKVLSLFGVLILCLLVAATSCAVTWLIIQGRPAAELSAEELYSASVKDAVFADSDEIMPLVTIEKNSELVTWDDAGEKILMLSWNKYPDSYIAGSTFICRYGEIWTFTDREIVNWYRDNSQGVSDWNLRLQQLIGLPPTSDYTHVSAFWADPDEVIRPAYQTDITGQIMPEMLDGSKLGDYTSWFEGNLLWSYFNSEYPWTRLGYTYDWADNGVEYGLSEFIILPDSEIEVEWTVTTDEFIEWLSGQAA